MTTVLVPSYVLLICVAPRLVADVLGERWIGTETIIQLLALVGIVGLFGDMTGPLFRGLGYPQWLFSIEVCQSTLVVVLLWTLTGRYGVLGAAFAWLIATGSSQIVSFHAGPPNFSQSLGWVGSAAGECAPRITRRCVGLTRRDVARHGCSWAADRDVRCSVRDSGGTVVLRPAFRARSPQ